MKILLSSILIFTLIVCMAQSNDKNETNNGAVKKIEWGIKAGINASNLIVKSDSKQSLESVEVDTKSLFRGHFGVLMNYHFNNKFALQPELVLSFQGAKAVLNEYLGAPLNLKKNLDITYLMLPVNFQYYVSNHFRLELGPQLGYILTKDLEIKGNFEFGGQTYTIQEKIEDLSEIDFSVNIGLGYIFAKDFVVYGKYNRGLNSINSNRKKPFDWSIYNEVIQMGVEYKF